MSDQSKPNKAETRSIFINFSKLAGFDVRVTGDMKDVADLDVKSVASAAVLCVIEGLIQETNQEIAKLKKSRAKVLQSKLVHSYDKLKTYETLKSQLCVISVGETNM